MSRNRLVVVGITVAMMALSGGAQGADKREVVFVSAIGGVTLEGAAPVVEAKKAAAKPIAKGGGRKKPTSETVPQSSLLPTGLPQFPDDYQIDDDSLDED